VKKQKVALQRISKFMTK